MKQEDTNIDPSSQDLNVSIEPLDNSDDRKPTAKLVLMRTSTASPVPAPQVQVKRKRRSPEKPWKKPADMPKRPLSAYNIFFRDERERLLSAGSEGKNVDDVGVDNTTGSTTSKPSAKKQKKPSGIGFANLAKSIAAKWKDLENDVRSPYEKIAATEKKKYDVLVAEWRIKQNAKKKALAAAKKQEALDRKNAPPSREPHAPNLYSSERSLGSFSDTSNPYPSEWFHSSTDYEPSERDDRNISRSTMPPVPVVNMTPRASYDRRGYDSSIGNPAWQQNQQQHLHQHLHQHSHQDPSSYYYQQTNYEDHDPYSRFPSDEPGQSYSRPHSSSRYTPGDSPLQHPMSAPSPSAAYRDYYHHTPSSSSSSSLFHRGSRSSSFSGRHGESRLPRAASLPAQRRSAEQQYINMGPFSASPPSHRQHQQQQRHHASSGSRGQSSLRDASSSSSRYPQPHVHMHPFQHQQTHHHQQEYHEQRGSIAQQHPRAASMPSIAASTSTLGEVQQQESSNQRQVAMHSHFEGAATADEDDQGVVLTGHGEMLTADAYMPVGVHHSVHAHAGTPSVSFMDERLEGTARRNLSSSFMAPDSILQPRINEDPTTTTTATTTAAETSLHSLNETLDDDAITFITSMKYS